MVSVGLDMTGITDWEDQRVLLVGTGSYAGAVVAALRQRGAGTVFSYRIEYRHIVFFSDLIVIFTKSRSSMQSSSHGVSTSRDPVGLPFASACCR